MGDHPYGRRDHIGDAPRVSRRAQTALLPGMDVSGTALGGAQARTAPLPVT